MNFFALFFLAVAALIYIILFIALWKRPSAGGERLVGFFWMLIIYALIFAGVMLGGTLLTLGIGALQWVHAESGMRIFLVIAGWGLFSVAFGLGVFSKWENMGDIPKVMDLVIHHSSAYLPPLVLVPMFVMARTQNAPEWCQWMLKSGILLSSVVNFFIFLSWYWARLRNIRAVVAQRLDDQDRYHKEHLEQVANFGPKDAILNIMAFTGRFHNDDLRNAAVAKIKERPTWEDELIALLGNEYYFYEAYTFLDGNKVDHPDKFLEPLEKSIHLLAKEIKARIKDSNNLQSWHFEHFGIERLLRAMEEQFLNKGMDFRPAMNHLFDALQTRPPERFRDVKFSVTPIVKDWLKKHA